jgi:hypothetical protein
LATPKDRIHGFRLGRRMQVRHLRTPAPHGWANSEGSDVVSSTIVSLSRCYQANIFQGWRIVIGRHALWLLV